MTVSTYTTTSDQPPQPRRRPYKRVGFVDFLLGFLTDLVVICAILLASFMVYVFAFMPVRAEGKQAEQTNQLEQQWAPGPLKPQAPAQGIPRPAPHDAFAKLTVPRFGDDWSQAVVAGVTQGDLRFGPGWYTDSQMPGEFGNFATAAHRDGSNAPYYDIDKLETCDEIRVETAGGEWVYKVMPLNPGDPEQKAKFAECAPHATSKLDPKLYGTLPGQQIVDPSQVDVVNPVPNNTTNAKPSAALLTFTSCNPHWSNVQRMIVHAALESSSAR